MIYWYSGTGNSHFVAEQIANKLNESLKPLALAEGSIERFNGESLGFVFPIYSWGIPPQVIDFVKSLSDNFIQEAAQKGIWMVCTCGDETGMAPEMMQRSITSRGVSLNGCWSVIMPNDYVLLPGFTVDTKEVVAEKLSACTGRIEEIAEKIHKKEWEWDVTRGSWPRLKTRLVYPLFKRWGVSVKKWYSEDKCIGCGKCASACPMKNIVMKEGRPKWNKNCASCCACFHICPINAVQYSSITRGKKQYFFPGLKNDSNK